MTNDTPAAMVATLFDRPELPAGDDERVIGFGVMGLPFDSGHYLGLRQFAAASFGPAYTSVWHGDPAGRWTFYATTPGQQSCSRYFSSSTSNDAVRCDVDVSWDAPWSVTIAIPGLLRWTVTLGATRATRLATTLGERMPEWVWTHPRALGAIGTVAGRVLGAGEMRLAGTVSNGQRYMVAPRTVWTVTGTRAVLDGVDLGEAGPLAIQARLGDFRLPQRGIAVIAGGHFETYDPTRHRRSTRTVALA